MATLLERAFSWVARELSVDWIELRSLLNVLWLVLREAKLVSRVVVRVVSKVIPLLATLTSVLTLVRLINRVVI